MSVNTLIKFYHIPKWAKYIVQEDNGKWYACEVKPELVQDNSSWDIKSGRVEQVHPVISTTLKEVNRGRTL